MLNAFQIKTHKIQRMAARVGLTFYIEDNILTYFIGGYDNSSRSATDEEMMMWLILCPGNPDEIQTTIEEVKASWEWKLGPFTINPKDFALTRFHNLIEENVLRTELMEGFIGIYQNDAKSSVYVSREIPEGYYYEGPRIPELHCKPEWGSIKPDLSDETVTLLEQKLKPFMTK
jgi:hypothetical protein